MDAAKAAVAKMTVNAIESTEVTEKSIEDNIKAQLEAAINNSNVTVQTDIPTADVPAAGAAKDNKTVYYALYVDGVAVETGSLTVSINHLYTEAELKAAVETAIAAKAKVSENATYSQFATKATEAVNAINGVSDFTITSQAPSNYAATNGNTFTLTYTLTYNGAVKTGSYVVTVVA